MFIVQCLEVYLFTGQSVELFLKITIREWGQCKMVPGFLSSTTVRAQAWSL